MAAGDLTTLANVQQWLGLPAGVDDALLTRMVSAISTFVQNYLNRQIASASYTERRDGTNNTILVFANYPVTAVSTVQFLSCWGQGTVTVPPSPNADPSQPGYTFDSKKLYLNQYAFPRGQGNVFLTYTAGYASTPLDLEQAVIETIGMRYRERDRIGQASKSIQGETVAFSLKDFPADVQTLLNQYKKVIPL